MECKFKNFQNNYFKVRNSIFDINLNLIISQITIQRGNKYFVV